MKKLLISFILLVTLSGCAAMFNGTSQQVSIRSKNPAAKIYVNDAYLGDGNVITVFKKIKTIQFALKKIIATQSRFL
ncbi:hypothetical protein [Vibrio sp. MEBiC08052]|uniref:hypothetical protein n=1 Tax=Vibrio sp. MEBiC08052 TaxID=1761910 RepID=UPI0007406089|nr:hypothetical protein [Vibrio sp. MEBiC08052]KUI97864.1 hypothetical protein VRK_25650 [Vibrio sp. MEBiC08052]